MNPFFIAGLSLLGLALLFFLVVILPTLPIARKVYRYNLVRTSPDIWTRDTTAFPDDAEAVQMLEEGRIWHRENCDCARPVTVQNDGLKLCGEYYDFGYKKAVLILSGRAEALTYAYYFAAPYRAACYNVLVIDDRAHGESEGKYNCVGLREYRDVLCWLDLLEKELGNETIVLHGICIGASTAMMAVTDRACPKAVKGIITDGMYQTFRETFRTHMIYIHRPIFPVLQECMFLIWLHARRSPSRNGPIFSIKKLRLPILMIYGKQDVFSLPGKSMELFELCPSDKRLVWFDKGGHSHLRVNAPEKYDKTITEFLEEKFS